MKLKPDAGTCSSVVVLAGYFMKSKPLGAEVEGASSVDASAAGYMKPKAEAVFVVGASSDWGTILGPAMNEKAGGW